MYIYIYIVINIYTLIVVIGSLDVLTEVLSLSLSLLARWPQCPGFCLAEGHIGRTKASM